MVVSEKECCNKHKMNRIGEQEGLDPKYLDKVLVPKREDRIPTWTCYDGTVGGLIKDTYDETMPNLERAYEGFHLCMLWMVAIQCFSIREAAMVVHSPIGCTAMYATANQLQFAAEQWAGKEELAPLVWGCTNITERDLVMGAEDKVVKAVKWADENLKKKYIIILTSCAAGIIGDDIQGIYDVLQPQIKATLVPLCCAGFRSRVGNGSAFDSMAHALVKYVMPRTPKKKQEDLVNVYMFMVQHKSEYAEMKRLIDRIGLKSNILPGFTPEFGTFEMAPEASATFGCCTYFADYMMKALKTKYGIPYYRMMGPIGIDNTEKWFRQMGEHFNCREEVERMLAEEHDRWMPQIEENRKKLRGKRVYVGANIGRAMMISKLCGELGMELVGLSCGDYSAEDVGFLEELKEMHGDFPMDLSPLVQFERLNILKRLKPDIVISDMSALVVTQKLGIPAAHYMPDLSDYNSSLFGYRGVASWPQRVIDALEYRGMTERITSRIPLPFRDSWWSEDPYKYIVPADR